MPLSWNVNTADVLDLIEAGVDPDPRIIRRMAEELGDLQRAVKLAQHVLLKAYVEQPENNAIRTAIYHLGGES